MKTMSQKTECSNTEQVSEVVEMTAEADEVKESTEAVKDEEYHPCASTLILSYCNTALEVATAHTIYLLSGSILLGIVSWISLLFLETKYLLLRKPHLVRICVKNVQEVRREMHDLLPEVSLINLWLFVLLRLVFLCL